MKYVIQAYLLLFMTTTALSHINTLFLDVHVSVFRDLGQPKLPFFPTQPVLLSWTFTPISIYISGEYRELLCPS
jgi:hypothetical protein